MGQKNTCDHCGKECGDGEAFIIPNSRRGKTGYEVLCQSSQGKEEGCLFDYLKMYKPKIDALNSEYRDKDDNLAINILIEFKKTKIKADKQEDK